MNEIRKPVSVRLFGNLRMRDGAAWKACLTVLLLVMVASSRGPIPVTAGVPPAQPTPGEGQPVTDTFAAVADAMIDSYRSAINFGGGQAIAVGYYSGDGAAIYRGLARFDLSSLPLDAVVISADLILLRAVGKVDMLPTHEPRLSRAVKRAYRLDVEPDAERLALIAENWRPYRTWVSVLLRNWLEDETHEIAGWSH